MKLCYYITSHGFGHAVRSSVIANAFPNSVELVFRTAIPESFFNEEMIRPFKYAPIEADCGCIQYDSLHVDIPTTLNTYAEINRQNEKRLHDETRWLKQNGVELVVTDVVPFACEAAGEAGVPVVVVTNFTWYDIYREYVERYEWFKPVLDKIFTQYRSARNLVALSPAMPMDYFENRLGSGLAGRKGTSQRDWLNRTYNLPQDHKLGLIYPGSMGLQDVVWDRLALCRGWSFIGMYPLAGAPANYRHLGAKVIPYADLTASVDCVISKLGYGVYSESVVNGVPLLYVPREDFAEYPSLHNAVQQWGYATCIGVEKYNRIDFLDELNELAAYSAIPEQHNQSELLAEIITRLLY